ncbi:hypothetical protein ABER23_33090 [Paenibacillus lautus]|uniref:hypothetical protein n=1 Tax=Paenibacillus lautus TaxID=1401 RepID=UPI003D2DC205
MIDLQKAELLTIEAAELYGMLISGKPSEEEYTRLRKKYDDIDIFGLLSAVYALRSYKYESRGWRRQRERIFKKSRRYLAYCEELTRSGL